MWWKDTSGEGPDPAMWGKDTSGKDVHRMSEWSGGICRQEEGTGQPIVDASASLDRHRMSVWSRRQLQSFE